MIKTHFINSTLAKYDDIDFAFLQTLLLEAGVFANSAGTLGLAVTQNGTPGMSVQVAVGKALVQITKSSKTFKVVVDSDAVTTVPITSNATGINRVDAIVVRVSTSLEPAILKDNVGTIERVLGTGATALSDGAITTALGTDGWIRLANVTVANGAVSILNASIADTRSQVLLNDSLKLSGVTPTGVISPYAGRTAPTGYLLCDGSAVSRSTYARLFEVICPASVFTVTIASPAVVTCVGHGLVAGDKIHFTTTGALPTGLSAGVEYFVLSTSLTTDTFRLALSPEGSAINTSGAQSGTHTLYRSAHGLGDGSSTFNVPDLRYRGVIGRGTSTSKISIKFESTAVNTGADTIAVPNANFPKQGQKIRLTTLGTLPTGLAISTDYYVIRVSATSIKLASSQVNANAETPTAIDITNVGSGTHTIEYTLSTFAVLGESLGEEDHAISINEMPSHNHSYFGTGSGSGGNPTGPLGSTGTTTGARGGDLPINNISPASVENYIIKT